MMWSRDKKAFWALVPVLMAAGAAGMGAEYVPVGSLRLYVMAVCLLVWALGLILINWVGGK